MKTIKSILVAAILISVSAVSMSAQEAAQSAQKHEFQVAKGDSVMIKRETEKYLTGQKPSRWVYDDIFIVGQLGTKRFPDGVMLMPILSWVAESDLKNVNGKAQESKEEAAAALAAEKEAEEQAAAEQKAAEQAAKQEAKQQAAEQKAAEEQAKQDSEAAAEQAEQAEQASVAAAAAVEQAKQDSAAAVEQAKQDSVAAVEQAKQDSVAAVEQAKQDSVAAVEQAKQDSIAAVQQQQENELLTEQTKGDSIHSKQNFKHGYDRFTIGARGGASALLHKVDQGNWLCGGDGILDLQYAHYWAKDGRPVDLGLIIGVGIGYSQSGMKSAVNTDTTLVDPTDGMHIDYHVHADEVKESDGQLQLEIPIMFSLITQNGFFFNLGPKFMLPLYTPYKQTISDNENTQISAYFQEIGVPVTNEVITGVLAENQYTTKATDNGNQFSINIMLGAELGWEWVLKSGNSFGLGVYGNYCLYNSFKNNTANIPLIEVTPPQGDDVAIVDVHSATKTYARGLGFFDAGLKIAYHFNFPKKRHFKDDRLAK